MRWLKHGRSKATVGAAGSLFLLAALPGGGAQAAPAVDEELATSFETCPEPFPVSDIVAGLQGVGLTVDRGTEPEPFTAEAVGVLRDGIAPGVDMILMEVDSPALDEAGGVWAGMSGSPVYAPDGRLIGSVSYGLGVPAEVAGITPAAEIYKLLDHSGKAAEPAEKVDLPDALQDKLVQAGAATEAEAAAGVERLALPLAVSGVAPHRLDDVAEQVEELVPGARVYASGSAPVDTPGSPDEIVPGGNFAAALSYGDVTFGGVGTTTAVCESGGQDVALAFGHPMALLGATSMSAHSANALLVQPDLLGPFKVANPGPAVGTVDQDRLAAIGGPLGQVPDAIAVESTLTSVDTGNSRSGTTYANVQNYLALVAGDHVLLNLDGVGDRVGGGSSQLDWQVSGTRASGEPFTVTASNSYADLSDIAVVTGIDLPTAIAALDTNRFEEVTITGVEVTGSVSSTINQYSIDDVLVRQPDGDYQPAPRDQPLPVEPGRELELRVVLAPYRSQSTISVDLTVDVPDDAAGQLGTLDVLGGATASTNEPGSEPGSFDELLDQLDNQAPNNSVVVSLALDGAAAPDPGDPEVVDYAVEGQLSIPVEVIAP